MFKDKSVLIENLKSPMNVASMTLDEIEQRLGGTSIIADPNSPFCHLLEFGSTVSSAVIQAMDEKLPTIYPARATTMEDLYYHMSDFDYLRMYSTPSQTTIRMSLPKKYLVENAMEFNENYKQITIPKDTVFMVGKYTFGIYYPINILINNFTKTFTVVHDTTQINPLHTLVKNVVDKYDMTFRGLEYLVIDFPVYQFAKGIVEEPLVSETGFVKKITYNNKFYALRIFNYKDGAYTEMAQTQSKMVYNSSTPTALVRVLPDEQKVSISVPQIYFDKGMMGSKLYIEIYTTLGALDIDTTNISGSSIAINFAQKSKDTTNYSAIFKNLPFDTIVEIPTAKISGGSNAIDVDTLRNRVVNDTLYEKAPISEKELEVYLEDNAFYLKKHKDNITERVYHAYRMLQDSTGAVIPSLTLPIRMLSGYADPNNSLHRNTFIKQSDESITILPTALFKYSSEGDDAVPITNEEMSTIAGMDKQQLADELNNSQYLKSPFHMRLDLSNSNPSASSFNLMNPEVKKIIFDGENYNTAAKMITFASIVEHLREGTGGYQVDISVYKSDDLRALSEESLIIYAAVQTTSGYWVGTPCTFNRNAGERDIYSFHIDTNYHLTMSGEIGITNFTNDNITAGEHMVALESDFYLIFLVDRLATGAEMTDAPAKVTVGVPETYLQDYVALSRQYLTIHLGHSLDDVIKHDMEISASSQIYETYDTNVQAVHQKDVYARNEDGTIATEVVDGVYQLKLLHQAGDPVFDYNSLMEDGSPTPVYAHVKGEVKKDTAGNPIIKYDRDTIYYTDTMFIDAKVFASERTAELSFVKDLPTTLEGYFDVIRNLQKQLLERTYVYFRCVRSTGSAKFNLGDGVITKQNIEMTFRITCYVPSYVKKNEEIQNSIKEKTCQAIEQAIQSKTISMLDVFSYVKEKMSDYVDHFTLLGVNGLVNNQTFTIVSEDAQPSVARMLELTDDNILSLNKQVIIEFVALDNNTDSSVTYEV